MQSRTDFINKFGFCNSLTELPQNELDRDARAPDQRLPIMTLASISIRSVMVMARSLSHLDTSRRRSRAGSTRRRGDAGRVGEGRECVRGEPSSLVAARVVSQWGGGARRGSESVRGTRFAVEPLWASREPVRPPAQVPSKRKRRVVGYPT